MSNLKRRIELAEKKLHCGDDDEIITIDLGTGQTWQMTKGEWNEIFRGLNGTRHLPAALREDNESV